jgi:ribosomal protein L4
MVCPCYPQTLSTYDLLKRTVLIITSAAAEQLEERLAKT